MRLTVRRISDKKHKNTFDYKAAVDNLSSIFSKYPEYQQFKQEFDSIAQKRKRKEGLPAWYELYDGCSSIFSLSDRLGLKKYYVTLYDDFSKKGHGYGAMDAWEPDHLKNPKIPDLKKLANNIDLLLSFMTGIARNILANEYPKALNSYGKAHLALRDKGKQLSSQLNNISYVIYNYVKESIMAYNHRLFLSATIAIGCAAEKALLLLLDAYISFLPLRQERDSFIKRTRGRFVKVQFEEFQKSLNGHRNEIDKELTDGIDIVISGVFELLRQNRNSTGHPTGKQMQKEEVFASLQVFVTYCKRIYKLINFFNANQNNEKNNPK